MAVRSGFWGLIRYSRQGAADALARPTITEFRAILTSPQGMQAMAFLAALAGAEFVTALADPRLGVLMHTIILVALLLQSAFLEDGAQRDLTLALVLAPLIRILSLSIPLQDVDLKYWYAVVAVPLLVGAFVVARMLNLNRRGMGLYVGSMRIQLLVACTGFAFGFIEYLILKPDPLIDSFSWGAIWLPALILLVATGFTEEFVFRGVMQSAAREALGVATIVYVSMVFAVLHIGYKSVPDFVFVLAIALFFAWVVMRTRSIVGVTLAHGLTNIMLFLVVPFLW